MLKGLEPLVQPIPEACHNRVDVVLAYQLSRLAAIAYFYGGKQRSRTPSRLREPGFQGQSQDQPRCITFQINWNR